MVQHRLATGRAASDRAAGADRRGQRLNPSSSANPALAEGRALIGQGPILGLSSGLSWGLGDFCGGLISRFTSTFTAVFTSQSVGLAGALVLLSLSGEAAPSLESVAFAAAAGLTGVAGLACFYYALSRGTMGVIAPHPGLDA